MKIIYTDTARTHKIELTVDQGDDIYYIIMKHALQKGIGFDLVHIDLRSESIEEVHCYRRSVVIEMADRVVGARVCSFGGAIAWSIYREVAEIWPQINYHLAGRPSLPPSQSRIISDERF